MSTLNAILEIGKRGLVVSQLGTNTVGNNIANVNTPGYSRQRVELKGLEIKNSVLGALGAGVDVERITRQRDLYLDRQLRTANAGLGRYEAASEQLARVEELLQEPNGQSLRRLLDDFWNAWYEVGNQPEDRSARLVLRSKASALTEGFHRLARGLTDTRERLNSRLADTIDLLNDRLAEIARLNGEILRTGGGNGGSNVAQDRRDLVLDEISKLASIDVVYREAGEVDVYIEGQAVVQGVEAGKLGKRWKTVNDEQILQLTGLDGKELQLRSGEIRALVGVRDTVLPDFQQALDEIAGELVTAVNDLHAQAFTSDGRQGLLFFDSTKTQAKDIALDAGILTDVTNVAVSSDGTPGNSDVALEIARLRSARLLSDGVSLAEGYQQWVTELGAQAKAAADSAESQRLLVGHLEDARESAQGVSLDEEMAQLITFQTAYGAAARIISAVDEMMDTLLRMV